MMFEAASQTDVSGWVRIGFSLCELGETGRSFFHQISQYYNGYDRRETDEKYTEFLRSYDGSTTLGTLFRFAKESGITFSMARNEMQPSVDVFPAVALPEPVSTRMQTNVGAPRTANQRLRDAANQPPIQQMVGSLWNTGELHILFGDNGTGKSVWAVQMADAISRGVGALSVLPNQCGPRTVLFYDFELSNIQFSVRYQSDSGEAYPFSERLLFGDVDFQSLPRNATRTNTDDLIFAKIIEDINVTQPDVLVIDNLSCLKTETTQEAKVALDVIQKLNRLKRDHGLSILLLAHTPKIKPGMPITNNDLAGSKQLSNLVDSISAIGKSTRSPEEKYIKHIKCRTGENIFGTENVISCVLRKESNFLRLDFKGCEHEGKHLRNVDTEAALAEKEEKRRQVAELRQQGLSIREITKQTGITKSSVQRWIQE